MLLAYVVGFFVMIVVGVMCVYREVYGEIITNCKVRMGYVAVKRLTIAYRMVRQRGIDRHLVALCREGNEMKYINIRYSCCRSDIVASVPDTSQERSGEIYATGIILNEDGVQIAEEDKDMLADLGYRIFTFPNITHAITAVYAVSNLETLPTALSRIYPVVEKVITEHRLCAYPQFEIYNRNHIQIIVPLSRQICYFVPETVPRSPYQWYLNDVQPHNQGFTETDQQGMC